jgi:hypothetical protein
MNKKARLELDVARHELLALATQPPPTVVDPTAPPPPEYTNTEQQRSTPPSGMKRALETECEIRRDKYEKLKEDVRVQKTINNYKK